MQGLESLNQFKNFVSSIGGLGRFEDTYIVHAAEGETVVPMEVLDRNPLLKKRLFKSMIEMGIEPGRYIVGNDLNSLNPVTGQPEFFLKKIFKRIKKAAADVSGYAAPIVGAMYGPAAGALVGAGLGAFKRENPGDPSQWAQMGMRGGAAGALSNLALGQKMFGGRGAYDVYGEGLGNYDVAGLGKRILGIGDKGAYEGPFGLGDFLKSGEDTYRNKTLNKLFGKAPDIPLTMEEEAVLDKPLSELTTRDKNILDGIEARKKGGIGPAGMSWKEMIVPYAGMALGLGALIDMTSSDEDAGTRVDSYVPHGKDYGWTTPTIDYGYNVPIVPAMGHGGVMDLRGGGESAGPGTGTSDSIPAMLSDGEFVMTAKAVRGAGGGNRREGARKMYEAMDRLEARA
jgi:hypothetical protein